ncbi:hypothetical protein [Isoptericola sp. BMS4]|uniref:hypothetical protein n=1 Tax=Isoptericola sp. BMS4 TaxID=2527875 RepID=UPI0014218FE8|nr:hypothetical protein [Isoptericola sp. BMS4]
MTGTPAPRRGGSPPRWPDPPATPTIRRTAEIWVAAVAAGLTTLLLGAFTLVVNGVDAATFADTLYPALTGAGALAEGVPVDAAYEAARTLAAWFGLTVVVVLGLTVAGVALARRRPARRTTGWWFLAAGLACLVGSQLLLYPIAFGFFVTAGLFALRKPDQQSETGSSR